MGDFDNWNNVLIILRKQYEHREQDATIPLMITNLAWSTTMGVYDCMSDRFIPSRGTQTHRTHIAKLTLQVTWNLPFDVTRHIASFLLDGNHIPEHYCTMSLYPFPWQPKQPTLSPTLAAILQPHGWTQHYQVLVAVIGQMIVVPLQQCYTLFVDDVHVFGQSELYKLLVSMTNFTIQLDAYSNLNFLPPQPHHINIVLKGTPSLEKETNVMDVIQLCCHWYKHRHAIAQQSPWIAVPQLDDQEPLRVDPILWNWE